MKFPILVYSASDRYNFGDMLYPIVLKELLKKNFSDYDIKFFALTSSDLSKDGAIPTQGYKKLQNELKKKSKKILFVAGGDGLFCTKNDLFSHSSSIDHILSKITSNSNLFFKIVQKLFWLFLEKRRKDIPEFPFHFKKDFQTKIIYNSIGGSRFFDKNQTTKFLHDIDVCSVRSSSDYNVFAYSSQTSLAPDFITLLSFLFSKPDSQFTSPFDKYIFFQISKSAYLQNKSEVVESLNLIYEKNNIPFILCPIGLAYGHEDFAALKDISSKLRAKHFLLKQPHVKDTIHLLANATLYIGTSLHGAIVSMSYERPYIGMRFVEKVAKYLDTWSINELKGCANYSILPSAVDKILSDSTLNVKLKAQKEILIKKTLENFNSICTHIKNFAQPKSPLVSVIVPNYNHALFLRQRFDSIFNQTYQNFEVIILDDCSTDNSKEIIEEYRDRPQVSNIVYNESNSGFPFKQWAKGFDLAQGEYIWIAESDDWAELNFLEEMVLVLNQTPSLVLAFCESYWEYPEKKIRGNTFKKDSFYKGLDFIKKNQIFNNHIVNASSALFRKQALSNITNDYQFFKGSGDYLFWSLLCENGDIYYTTELLNHFRRAPASTTSRCMETGMTFIEDFKIYKYFRKKGFISKFANYRIIEKAVSEIELYKKALSANSNYNKCKSLWEDERTVTSLTSPFLSFWANQVNRCNNLPFFAKIWQFLHLPNTNIRERILFRKKNS